MLDINVPNVSLPVPSGLVSNLMRRRNIYRRIGNFHRTQGDIHRRIGNFHRTQGDIHRRIGNIHRKSQSSLYI